MLEGIDFRPSEYVQDAAPGVYQATLEYQDADSPRPNRTKDHSAAGSRHGDRPQDQMNQRMRATIAPKDEKQEQSRHGRTQHKQHHTKKQVHRHAPRGTVLGPKLPQVRKRSLEFRRQIRQLERIAGH
jgi:hypothetical protein